MRKCAVLFATATTISSTIAVQAAAQSIPNNFYVRADVGWTNGSSVDIHDRSVTNFAIAGGGGHAGSLDYIGNAVFAGGGGGAQFTPYLRADIMYTWRGDYTLNEEDAAKTRFKSQIFSNSVMVNGYFDYPTNGVIPYLGFGLGWAETQMSSFSATSSLAVNPLASVPTGPTTAVAPGGSSDNFAWQVMAGLGVPLTDGIVFDLFYRYFDGGTMQTEAGTVKIGTTAVGTYAGVRGALRANEIGVSIRYAIQ